MANPGTIVGIGALLTPGGAQGPIGSAGNPGPAGPAGPPGGASANTTLTAAYTMPAVGASATANVVNAGAFSVGGIVYINPIGYLEVAAVDSVGNTLSLTNLGSLGNEAPGSVAPSGNSITGVGPMGPAGPAGSPGSQGPAGQAASISVGATVTGAPGTNASVVNSGSSSAAIFNFTIPQGANGAQGIQGNPGPPGSQGPPGNNGAVGAPGTAATITVGTTNTIAAGSPATVTNSGTATAAIFNFGIPQGVAGAQGPVGAAGQGYTWKGAWSAATAYNAYDTVSSAGSSYVCIAANTNQQPPNATYWNLLASVGNAGAAGPPGTAGANGLPAYNITTTGFTVPAIGATATVTLQDASWATVGEFVYVAGAAGTGTAAVLQITAKAGNTLTLLNPVPGGSYPLANTTVSGLLNVVSGKATDFIGGDNAPHAYTTIPLASTAGPGLLGTLSGNAGDFVDGTNHTQNLLAVLGAMLIPTGTILDYGGNSAPTGFLLCQGQTVSRTTFANLFGVIGTNFGSGDGSTTFGIPDLQGRASIGAGSGASLSVRAIGQSGGAETLQLSIANLPSHNHGINDPQHNHSQNAHGHGFNDPQHLHSFTADAWSGSANSWGSLSGLARTTPSFNTAASGTGCSVANSTAGNNASGTGITTQSVGSGTAVILMNPFCVVNKMIKI